MAESILPEYIASFTSSEKLGICEISRVELAYRDLRCVLGKVQNEKLRKTLKSRYQFFTTNKTHETKSKNIQFLISPFGFWYCPHSKSLIKRRDAYSEPKVDSAVNRG